VAVEAVVGDVGLGADEPLDGDVVLEVVLADLGPLLFPEKVLLRVRPPKAFGIGDGAVIHLLVLLHRLDVRLGGKLGGRFVDVRHLCLLTREMCAPGLTGYV
jgi:hypothetical protein